MTQICNNVITMTLKLIFEQLLQKENFPEILKVANAATVHKKEDNIIALTAYFQKSNS